MKKALTAGVTLMAGYVPFVHADSQQSETAGNVLVAALVISGVALAYCGNRWRRWWLGFQVGDATASEFLGALKWSAIGVVVVVASFGIAVQFN